VTIPDAFAGIALRFSQVMGGPYVDGIVRDNTDDEGGSIVSPGVVVERDCSVQVDSVTEAMRQAEGFTEKDVRLLIIALTGALNTDARVEVLTGPKAGVYRLLSASSDPVAIGWECRARLV
jgi:hypothetical protein